MTKNRGRKRKIDPYFGPEQESAVFRFLKSDDQLERSMIYNEYLRDPLNKMTESIIRRYKLYPKTVTFEEIHMDALSFLMTKAHLFENNKGTKAYSYYGTIIKNYVLNFIIKEDKQNKQSSSFEDVYLNLEEDQKFTYTIDENLDDGLTVFIENISDEIKYELNKDDKMNHTLMNDNERKLGYALIDLLTDWERLFKNMDGGNKYNKLSILASIREYTNLTTKEIRVGMERYKKIYRLYKNKFINGD